MKTVRGEGRMPAPYGLPIFDDCLTCPVRENHVFCNLGLAAVKSLDKIKSLATYPKGALLFIEGQEPRGVFVLCAGRVKLTTTSGRGKALILRLAEQGELLGLGATVSERPYDMTAETLEPCECNFIRRQDFLGFLREHGDASLRVAQQLAKNFYTANEQIRTLGLSPSVVGRLAKFVLSMEQGGARAGTPVPIKLRLNHEEIAQMIGSSRETVTRLLTQLRRQEIIYLKGPTLRIRNRAALEALAAS